MSMCLNSKVDEATAVVVSCEHGGAEVPKDLRRAFLGCEDFLCTHRGYDAGALHLARLLAREVGAPLFYSTVTRLVVDLNRSEGHPRLHAEPVKAMAAEERARILDRHYRPFRAATQAAVQDLVTRERRVLHLSVHSFTPVLNGRVRQADVGLLYDPGRPGEVALCRCWRDRLREALPHYRVRMNYPYRGTSDAHVTALRRGFPPECYLGIELEFNHALLEAGGTFPTDLASQFALLLREAAAG